MFGYHFHPNIAAEIAGGYYQTEVPVYIMGAKIDTTFRVYPIAFNVVFRKRMGNFEPYIKGVPDCISRNIVPFIRRAVLLSAIKQGLEFHIKNSGLRGNTFGQNQLLKEMSLTCQGQ